jgi:hypothetical protein
MSLCSFYLQASNVGETRGLVPGTVCSYSLCNIFEFSAIPALLGSDNFFNTLFQNTFSLCECFLTIVWHSVYNYSLEIYHPSFQCIIIILSFIHRFSVFIHLNQDVSEICSISVFRRSVGGQNLILLGSFVELVSALKSSRCTGT